MKYLKKKTLLAASRRIDNCPTPRQRFPTNFPTAGTYEMANARQMPGRGMGWARLELTELLQPVQISSWIFERRRAPTALTTFL